MSPRGVGARPERRSGEQREGRARTEPSATGPECAVSRLRRMTSLSWASRDRTRKRVQLRRRRGRCAI
ncbi:hypothetical protein FKM82_004881 [Ascaphus truei]